MKQTPILFSTPMVQAILAGRKFQTRRDRNLQRVNSPGQEFDFVRIYNGEAKFCQVHNWTNEVKINCPYGQPGDVLWVKETHLFDEEAGIYKFAADMSASDVKYLKGCWTPSIHMPKEAARVWLEIVSIRVERLQDISEADALAEGIEPIADGFKNYGKPSKLGTNFLWPDAYHSFQSLWESINGSESWDANPWLWVVEFKMIEKPEGK